MTSVEVIEFEKGKKGNSVKRRNKHIWIRMGIKECCKQKVLINNLRRLKTYEAGYEKNKCYLNEINIISSVADTIHYRTLKEKPE